MLLGMLEFLLFYESMKIVKDVLLMHGYENGEHGGYGNEGSLCRAFLLFRDNIEYFCYFVSLKNREYVDESENMWKFLKGCKECFQVGFNIYHTPVIFLSV